MENDLNGGQEITYKELANETHIGILSSPVFFGELIKILAGLPLKASKDT
jgi:hypothetical protein